ncbi:MAG: copper homeostasis protein CutC [Acidobacteriota bacterium]
MSQTVTNQQPLPRLLEVIVCTVEDAIAAENGGAGRLEIISHFEVGGLTPAVELVREILNAVAIPARVMLRENAGFNINAKELKKLANDAKRFAELGVDGLVLGFLRDGEIDVEAMNAVLGCAPKMKATFHRAFEQMDDPFKAITVLKNFTQIDRILTSGRPGEWQRNIEFLKALQQTAQPEIAILVGGGLDAQKLQTLGAESTLREFHVGRSARLGEQLDEGVDAEKVSRLLRLLN